ncbi:MAG: CBS domain-containing protein [Euryarchaeota archaeon]|nr:CBS domain-containing protein [Euryarchaeota archaeon]MDE1837413.1 CBS domain-containing protein [Euryarchaeota archaeon]MDE1879904.1 CBS domain-containing protein [Euryarchaeota archaeon]MDE2045487.1 CBS domain-containing protein [Thermoplasmata archaeon]
MPDEWPLASDLMTSDPITLDVEDTLSRALGIMRSKHIHEIPLLRAKRLAGMVTYDALGRRHTLALSTKLEHVMVLPPTIPPNLSFPEIAERLLASGRRAACVVDSKSGKLLGVVSRTDLVRALPTLPRLAEHSVAEVMSPANVVVQADDPCRSLFSLVRELEEHPLPVVDGGQRLVGAVSLTDIGNAFWRPMEGGKKDPGLETVPEDARVQSIMTRPPLTVPRRSTAGEAARLMTKNRSSSVFVAEGEAAMGLVSQADLLGLAVRHAPDASGVYIQISGLTAGSDPTLMTDLDAVLSKGLKRIARAEAPRMLSVHVVSHPTKGLGAMSLEARLHGPSRIYNASRTDYNLLKAAADVMEELERQVRGVKAEDRERSRGHARRMVPGESSELIADPELEQKIPESLQLPAATARALPRGRRG